MQNLIIGSHVSFNKNEQLLGSTIEAVSYKSNTFMFYTGAPQNTNRYPIDIEMVNMAKKLMKEQNIDINNVIVHAPYIINLANANNFDFNVKFLKEELKRVKMLGISKLVLHPGSHVCLGVDVGIKNIIDSLNLVTGYTDIDICLETMAGKGTEIGRSFEELKQIIDGVKDNKHIKVCLDTCHINDAGYDLNNFDEVLKEFDKIIGLDRLSCVHVNDSKNTIGTHKDRHDNIGLGTIGFENLLSVIYNEKLKDVPKILETPYVGEGKEKYPPYLFEIEMIRNKKINNNIKEDILDYYKKF